MSKSASKILFNSDFGHVKQNDVRKALEKIGVKERDIIMVHSDIGTFGKLGTADRDFLLKSLIDALKEVIGPGGTIVMPTFTYSFYKNKPYDIKNSKSTVGVLTEYFRKLNGVSRSAHPTHSVALWGNKKELLDVGNDTFDRHSIFGKLHKLNAKHVFLGVSFQKSCTFVHYIEQMHGVPYRYMKTFKGKITVNNKVKDGSISLYYRYFFFSNSFLRLENHLLKKGLLKQQNVGNSSISMIDSNSLFDECCKLLDKDEYYLLKNNTVLLKIFNCTLHPFLKYLPLPMRKLNDMATGIFSWIKFKINNQMD